MLSEDVISELRESSEGLTLLYVEDNKGLQVIARRLMEKFFSNVISASDGEEGYQLFKELRPQIIITDIRMPRLNGLDMIKKIKKIDPDIKVIITSAYDDKEYLLEAVKIGVFDYLKKPVKIDDLASTLLKCIKSIDSEENGSLFNSHISDMVNYQRDILALVSNGKILFVNQMFLEFFNVATLDDFDLKYEDFGALLLEHKDFLYNHDNTNWFDEASREMGKLFPIKLVDQEGKHRHFILKMHAIPKKETMFIMSLNDITDLNLLSIFDHEAVNEYKKPQERSTLLNFLKVIHKNGAEIKIHNFFKGLSITHSGSVSDINEHIVIKTSFMQQKACQYQKSLFITSDLFPGALLCEPIIKIDFEEQSIVFKEMHLLQQSPIQRKSVRVFPEEHHTVTLFFEDRKFYGDIFIHDISIEAVKLEASALPAGLKVDSDVAIDMVLEYDKKPVILHIPAKIYRIDEMVRSFFIVLTLKLESQQKRQLIDYIAKRQMNLIYEFKGMQFG